MAVVDSDGLSAMLNSLLEDGEFTLRVHCPGQGVAGIPVGVRGIGKGQSGCCMWAHIGLVWGCHLLHQKRRSFQNLPGPYGRRKQCNICREIRRQGDRCGLSKTEAQP